MGITYKMNKQQGKGEMEMLKPASNRDVRAFSVNDFANKDVEKQSVKGATLPDSPIFHKHNSSLINVTRPGMFDFETKCPFLKTGVFVQPVVRIHHRRTYGAPEAPFRPKPATDNGVH